MNSDEIPPLKMNIEITQIIRSKRKTIALIIQRDGALIVRAPLRASEKTIREFAGKNAQWIQKTQALVRAAIPGSAKRYVPSENFLYLGREYPVEIVKGQKPELVLDNHFKLAESAHDNAEQVFQQWYQEQARRIIPERVRHFANQHHLQFHNIRIGSARTRWGSCNSKGDLNFSWRLILTPMEIVDYVVVHELAHILVHNHSSRFWKQVEKILPDYNEHNKWLRKNGRMAML